MKNMKIEKYLVKDNPFVESGKSVLKVTRETKTLYICKVNDSAELKFRKNKEEKNGDLVYSIPYVKHDRAYTLVIKEVEE
jgi:hypothetical protein